MKKILLLLLTLTTGLTYSQDWFEIDSLYNASIINFQSVAVDESTNKKYVFYIDDSNNGRIKEFDAANNDWVQITTTFNLIGTAIPEHPSILAKDGELVLGFYDAASQQYFIFYNGGGSFNQVGAPLLNQNGDPELHAKLVYNTDFTTSYLMRYSSSDGPLINVQKIDIPGGSFEDFGDLPLTTPPTNASKPDIFATENDIWIICEEYFSGADKAYIMKCPSTTASSWAIHANIGDNLDEFSINGDPAGLPYFAYEDLENFFLKLDKVSAANYDNISQLSITGSGVSNVSVAWSPIDEAYLAYKDLANNKLWVKKHELGALNNYGGGDFGNYINYGLINLAYDFGKNSLNLGYTVPAGAPGFGGHVAYINDAPSGTSIFTKVHCANTNPSDTLAIFRITDNNRDSAYVISATSSNQSIVADASISGIINPAHSIGQSIRDVLINVSNVLNDGAVNISVVYTDGLDTLTQVVPYSVNALPTITLTEDPIQLCEGSGTTDLNSNVSPLGGSWTVSNLFDPSANTPGGYTRDYTYTDGNGCESTETQNITVFALPTVVMTVGTVDLCYNSPLHNLLPYGTPSGGTYLEGDNFDATSETIGTHARTYQYTDLNGCINSETIDVVLHAEPSVTFTNNPVELCLNDSQKDLYTVVVEQGGAFSPSFMADPSILGVGTHNHTYTYPDAYGCTTDTMFNVIVNTLPSVAFHNTSIQLCSNGELYDLYDNIDGVFNGFWLGQNELFNPIDHVEGSIVDQIFQSLNGTTGCSNQDTFQIELLTIPTTSLNITNASCGVDNGSIDLTQSSGNGATTVYWNNGSSNEDLTDLLPGTYYANITDAAGCIAVAQADVQSTEISLSANITNATCHNGNDGSIDLTVTGANGPFLFLWATADSTEDVSNLTAGTYFVTVTDASGCITTANYYVDQPDAIDFDWSIVDADCGSSNGSILVSNETGGSGNYTYNWAGGISTTNIAAGLAGGSYNFNLSDDNGCDGIEQNFIITSTDAPVLSVTTTNSNCNQDNGSIDLSTNVDAGAIASIDWSNSETTENLTGLAPGVYSVEVEDTAGCIAYLTTEVKIVRPMQNDICVVTVDSMTTTNLVVWERVQPTGIDHYNIYRENAIAGEYIKIDEVDADSISQYVDLAASPEVRSWRYKISATNDCDVEGPQSLHHKTIHIVYQPNGSDFEIHWDEYEGFTYATYFVDRRDAITPEWTEVGQVMVGNALTLTDTPPTTDGLDYRVTVVSPGTCSATKANDYNSSRSNRSAGIFAPGDTDSIPDASLTEMELSYNVSIFPNPTTSNISVSVDQGMSINSIEIKNVNGQTIYKENATGVSSEISLEAFESGIYFVLVSTNQGKSIHKMIKK